MLFFARFVQADEEVERKRKERDNLYTFIYYAGIVFLIITLIAISKIFS